MTKEVLYDTSHDHALTLPCFPSCDNCLAWSDDALAFAGGPNVYLITKKFDSTDSLIWHKDSLRVDTFSEEEYLQPDPATISDLSLGEEQPESVVVALAWSPPGLGLHCRAVLAVLTSNLLLSIWETNGSQRGWRRSCIINQHLQTSDQSPVPRRSLRIRSFAWSHPLVHTTQPKWGSHFLTLADDDNNLFFCNIRKSAKDNYGQWSVTILSTVQLRPSSTPGQQDQRFTSIQQILIQHSTIRSISVGAWKDRTNDDSSKIEARAVISCQRFHSAMESTLLFEVAVSKSLLDTEPSVKITAVSRGTTRLSNLQSGHINERAEILYNLDDKTEWREGLENACNAYSKKYRLNGLFRIRFRGYAISPCHGIEAASVTLHPQDIYEYTPQGNEECHILFRPLPNLVETPKSRVDSESSVLERTIGFMSSLITSRELKWNLIDRELLEAYERLVVSQPSLVDNGEILNASLKNFRNAENGSPGVSAHGEDTITPRENCTMCGSAIDMTLPISSAICRLGHHFIRCSLSLISIQEPGISKRCSGCNRQFLDIAKLGPLEGPSLAQELFDEFDVCPYCKEKYQG